MTKKTRKFKAEVQQLLDLVIHSLYSKQEIFLRELISNASDALDRARFESLTDKSIQVEKDAGRIKISVDKEKRTLTITDNGIGMGLEEIEKNIGTIANSGTRRYLEALKESGGAADAEMIGQFGVGFYAAFMVADKVEVVTRHASGAHPALKWISKGEGQYTIDEVEKEETGTEVTLHLREGVDEYLEEYRLRSLIKTYSDYISYPVVMDVSRPGEGEDAEPVVEEETLNSMKALWKRNRKDIEEAEYNDFYKHLSHDFSDPAKVIHWNAEGTTEFSALLYLPAKAPVDMFWPEGKKGLQLYVKNVFITEEDSNLLPTNLRFVKGVVDSSDLPLNVSREMLQDDAVLRRIKKNIVSKVLKTLSDMKDDEREVYDKFYAEFGPVLKEGLQGEFDQREKLQELLLFHSTKTEADAHVSLKEYVERMPDGQDAIYYLTSADLKTAEQAPHLEVFRDKGYEVLFMTDTIDEWALQGLTEYDGKQLKPIDRGDLDLESEAEKEVVEKELKEVTEKYQPLLDKIQSHLGEEISSIRFSTRLKNSPCCLVNDEGAMSAHMEKIMRAMNQEMPATKRIMELNPKHELLEKMQGFLDQNADEKLQSYTEILYGQALLLEGTPPNDPARFSSLLNEILIEAG